MTHWELREWHGSYDLVKVDETGRADGHIALELHDRTLVNPIAELFDATIIPEPHRVRVGAQVEEVG